MSVSFVRHGLGPVEVCDRHCLFSYDTIFNGFDPQLMCKINIVRPASHDEIQPPYR